MEIKKTIVLIPYWIEEILKRNKLPLATCLDPHALKNNTSLQDLITFAAAQSWVSKISGVSNDHVSLFQKWCSSCGTDQQRYDEAIQWYALAEDAQFQSDAKSRLFEESTQLTQYKEPFTIHDISPDVCGVVIYPGFFTGGPEAYQLQMNLVEAVLKVLYTYNAFHEVATTSYFKRFLELLQQK